MSTEMGSGRWLTALSTRTADAGESYEFTVTFETPGTYKLYCVPHETLGMIGEVNVQ